ncbi:MAG: NmrA family NAD(P)-binding protein [Balneolaceae bacterium]|jgi:uncharacterized protein YbjT (DUF2867 family)
MKILVLGGTGTVGSQVVHELLKRDTEVHVLTRKVKTRKDIPSGVIYVSGDLLNVDTIRSVFKNIDAVFLLNAVSLTETHEGLMALNGAILGGVKNIVYLSVHQAEEAPHLPHFGAKLAIETAIKASGIPYTILRPNNFYQNDYWFKESLLKYNVYPQPLGNAGVSRVDVRDIAEAAAIALTSDKHHGKTYNMVGPNLITGESSAELWSSALKKIITYGGDNLDAWEKQALQYSPAWMVFDFKLMYSFFQLQGFKATREDIRRETALLGHEPRSYKDYVNETAEIWKKEPVTK